MAALGMALEHGIRRVYFGLNYYCREVVRKSDVVIAEVWANIFGVLPNAVKWCYRRVVGQITAVKITALKTDRVASLYFHSNKGRPVVEDEAVLVLHGLHGYSFSTLHMADKAVEFGKKTFSLHMKYDNEHLFANESRVLAAVAKIYQDFKDNGRVLRKLTMIGHSRGGTEAIRFATANKVFLQGLGITPRVLAIASRLRDVPSETKPAPASIKPMLASLYPDILDSPEIDFWQVAGTKDWNAELDAMIVRHDARARALRIENAKHLDVIFHPAAISFEEDFLRG